ncbi:hypothetical protein NCCP2222_32750 [Sporosarcina sp. NCCP-2222]|uniref:hypothetical protein n=1 Tax=Sporosarcina sp. NCCP-2222 TaxID=2935073 RepID=UPI00208B7992|nr:hypothetical protein [Sporosarcina sp. NCCP-2222]GKV57328.1 hypothetical protein NCCP2222_32750 [Sporosarcina sp. NCCP-2222]
MKKDIMKILGILTGIFVITIGIIVIGVVLLFNQIGNYFGHADEDLIRYAEKTHGIEVKVVDNPGREPASFGGLIFENATVRTLDAEQVTFEITINVFGHISGDNYVEAKKQKDEENEEEL